MKERIYLDTSVISYLRQEDAPLEMRITNEFWEILKRGDKYDVYISDVTILELARNKEPKRSELLALLEEIEYTEIKAGEDTHINKILEDIEWQNLLTPKSMRDRTHIAVAILCQCRFIISWNFRHISKENTRRKVRIIAASEGINEIDICSPKALMRGEYNDA